MRRILNENGVKIGSLLSGEYSMIEDKIKNFKKLNVFLRTYFSYIGKIKSDFHYLDY